MVGNTRYGLLRLLVLSVVVSIPIMAGSQFYADRVKDSLLARYKEIPGNTEIEIREKVDILLRLGEFHSLMYFNKVYHKNNFQLIYDCNHEALRLSDQINYHYGKARALQSLGFLYGFMGERKSDSAYMLTDQSIALFSELGETKDIGLCYNNLAYLQYGSDDDSLSTFYVIKADSLFRVAGANRELAIAWETLGLAYVQHALFERADWWFRLALEYREKDAEPINIAVPLIHLGNLHYFHLDNTDSALIFYKRAKEFIEKSGKFYAQGYACDLHDVNLYALVLYYTGNCLKEMQDYDRALEHYNKTLDVLDKDKMKSPRDTGIVILELAETLHLLGQDSMALSMILQGFKRGFWFLDWEQNFHRYRVAAAIYEGLGNYREALNYQKLFHESEDSADVFYYDRDRLDFFARARAFELAEKNKLLAKDMAIQELKLQRGTLAKWLLAAGLAILFILFAFYLYQYWLKKKLSRELELKVADAIHKHKQQQQIIVHQAGLTSLGEMAAGIAHEINQPLQDLRLLAETMDRDIAKGILDADYLLNSIKDQLEDIRKISHIVEHVQVFSSQQKTETLERFVINEPILAAHALLNKQFLKDNIDVDFSLQPELPEVMGNPYKFEQVVINLLNNARSAVNEKAGQGSSRFDKKVLVKTSLKAIGKQNPSSKAMIIMEVRDNGSGIPGENLTSIFLPFFTTKELGKGIGLGLSISHGIISEMNGTINVTSKVGEGSCFTVELPGAD